MTLMIDAAAAQTAAAARNTAAAAVTCKQDNRGVGVETPGFRDHTLPARRPPPPPDETAASLFVVDSTFPLINRFPPYPPMPLHHGLLLL